MKFSASIAALVLANSAWASPLSAREKLSARLGSRRTGMKIPAGNSTAPIAGSDNTAATISQSSNWAGAALVTTGVTEVTGTFTIPKPTVPSGGSTRTEFCGAAWVGIDGDTCQTSLIQTGVFWCVEDGEFSYEAWYEYIPAASIAYTGISVTSGDEIKVSVTKSGNNGGTTTLENVGTGQTVSHTFSGESAKLCGDNAEWIVEDFESGDSLVPFANFGTVTFTGATAVVNGATVDASTAAENIELVSSSDSVLTSTTISGTTVTVKYE